MDIFRIGNYYTRSYISKYTGGGAVHYLPYDKNKKVVCAALRPEMNPDAPNVICVTEVTTVKYWAKMFSLQKEFVPLFIRRDYKMWEYVGNYRVKKVVTDPDSITYYEEKIKRNLSFLLNLEKENLEST